MQGHKKSGVSGREGMGHRQKLESQTLIMKTLRAILRQRKNMTRAVLSGSHVLGASWRLTEWRWPELGYVTGRGEQPPRGRGER